MLELSEQQITDAKNNDLDAVTAIITATEPRVTYLANQAATIGSRFDADLAEDLAQTGRIAVWEAIDRFKGTDVAQFAEFVDVTLRGVMANTRKEETRTGVSRRAAADFEKAIALAGGDPYEAERVAQDAAAMGDRKMSPEGAYACRMAWQGTDSLDVPVSGDAGATVTVGELIAGSLGIPEDLLTERDIESHRQRTIRDRVHATLGKLSERMSTVLRQDYGIGDVPYYGDQVGEADAEMAADMSLTTYQVQQARTKGRVRFRDLYLKGAAA